MYHYQDILGTDQADSEKSNIISLDDYHGDKVKGVKAIQILDYEYLPFRNVEIVCYRQFQLNYVFLASVEDTKIQKKSYFIFKKSYDQM